jgi:hypothetical protein
MKFYNIILFASLILYILSSACSDKESAESSDDCKNLSTSKADGHCCFVKGKDLNKKDISRCISLEKSEYDNIKDYIKSLENQGAEVKKLDCKSIYLELSILSFILLLL